MIKIFPLVILMPGFILATIGFGFFFDSRTNNSVARLLSSRPVNIPCFHNETKAEKLRIIGIIKEAHEINSVTQI